MGIADIRNAFNEAGAPAYAATTVLMDYEGQGATQILRFAINGPNGPINCIERVPPGGDLISAARALAVRLVKDGA